MYHFTRKFRPNIQSFISTTNLTAKQCPPLDREIMETELSPWAHPDIRYQYGPPEFPLPFFSSFSPSVEISTYLEVSPIASHRCRTVRLPVSVSHTCHKCLNV